MAHTGFRLLTIPQALVLCRVPGFMAQNGPYDFRAKCGEDGPWPAPFFAPVWAARKWRRHAALRVFLRRAWAVLGHTRFSPAWFATVGPSVSAPKPRFWAVVKPAPRLGLLVILRYAWPKMAHAGTSHLGPSRRFPASFSLLWAARCALYFLRLLALFRSAWPIHSHGPYFCAPRRILSAAIWGRDRPGAILLLARRFCSARFRGVTRAHGNPDLCRGGRLGAH